MVIYGLMRWLLILPIAVVGLATTRSPGYGLLPKPASGRSNSVGIARSYERASEQASLRELLRLTTMVPEGTDARGPETFATDQGRLYFALGAPTKVLRYSSGELFCPLEIWHYQAIPKLKISHSVEFLFFKDQRTGKYRMYAPSMDGIQNLIQK